MHVRVFCLSSFVDSLLFVVACGAVGRVETDASGETILCLRNEFGVSLNDYQEAGQTALHLAASLAKVSTVRCLLQLGADHTLTSCGGRIGGYTPWDQAKGRKDIIKMMLDEFNISS